MTEYLNWVQVEGSLPIVGLGLSLALSRTFDTDTTPQARRSSLMR